MPCDQRALSRYEQEQREEAIRKLEEDIAAGRRTVMRNLFTGEVSISDWENTWAAELGICEGCAMIQLQSSESEWVRDSLKAAGVETGKEFVAASHNGHPHGGGKGHGH